ncbi:reverse transcriptase domain-containing protein [Tanacetum coccineum]
MLAVVYAFEKFWPYLVLSKSIMYTDHSALKYLKNKQDAKPRLLRWVLVLQEFDIIIRDKKGSENLAADHLSRLENPHKDVLENKDINEHFPLEMLGTISSGSTPWFADYSGVTHRLTTAYHPKRVASEVVRVPFDSGSTPLIIRINATVDKHQIDNGENFVENVSPKANAETKPLMFKRITITKK